MSKLNDATAWLRAATERGFEGEMRAAKMAIKAALLSTTAEPPEVPRVSKTAWQVERSTTK